MSVWTEHDRVRACPRVYRSGGGVRVYSYNTSKMVRDWELSVFRKSMNGIQYKAGVEGPECVCVNNGPLESIYDCKNLYLEQWPSTGCLLVYL